MFTVRVEEAAEATMFPTSSIPHAERSFRALVLDGDGASLAKLQAALHERGVTAVTASDGTAGLERLFEELLSLDVLVMDLDLPHRDARAFTRLVREAGNERDLTLVVVATAPDAALRDELDALGVDAVVDRRAGHAAAATAALDAVRARRDAEEIELETWRHAPAAGPIGETSWEAAGFGGMAMVA
jgi:CheY-like chemotaxis protein